MTIGKIQQYAKISMQKLKQNQNICIVLKYFPQYI